MNYEEAKKAVELSVKPGYLIVSLGYYTVVLPHSEGLKLLETLKCAEQADNDYNIKTINPLQQDSLTTKLMSFEQYQRIKISMLLGVSVSEVQDLEKAGKPKQGTVWKSKLD